MPSEPETLVGAAESSEVSGESRIILRLTKPHSLINRALQQQEIRNRPDYSYAREVQVVDVHASKKQYRTALAILDRLFKALELQGFEVVLDNPQYGRSGTFARKGRDQWPIRLEEVHEQVAHEMTAKEKSDQERYGSKPPKWDSIPTGQFTLSPGGKIDLRAEDTFTVSLARTIAAITQHVEEECKKREERERRERKEAHRQRLQYEEEQRIKAFRESAQSFQHYRVLMEYIEEVRRHKVVPTNQRREGQTVEEWLSWAEMEAQRFHPLA